MVQRPRSFRGRDLRTIYRDDKEKVEQQADSGPAPRIGTSVVTESAPVADYQAFEAAQRFEARGGGYPSIGGGEMYSDHNVARAVGFMNSETEASYQLDLCPVCSLPLLHQDLASSKGEGDNKHIVLCQSSTSSTTTGTRLHADSTTVGTASLLEDYSLHDFDTRPPPRNQVAGPACGVLLPIQSVLEQFVGTYCDYVSGPKNGSSDQLAKHAAMDDPNNRFYPFENDGRSIDHSGSTTRQIPPFCNNCKAYIVQENGDEEVNQDEMLSNLASWLATSQSTDDGGADRKIAFRPSHGSIKVILDKKGSSRTQASSRSRQIPPMFPTINTHCYAQSQVSSSSAHWEAMSQMSKPTPRQGIAPRQPMDLQDRYSIDEENSPERGWSNKSFTRSPSPRRRRKYMNLLDEDDPVEKKEEPIFTGLLPDPSVAPKASIYRPDPSPNNESSCKPMYKPANVDHVPSNEGNTESSSSPDPPASNDKEVLMVLEMEASAVASNDEQEVVLEMVTLEEEHNHVSLHSLPSSPSSKQSLPIPPSLKPSRQPASPPKRFHASSSPKLSIVVPPPVKIPEAVSNEYATMSSANYENNDDASIGTCNTLMEETIIIGDYDEKRNIATKAIGRKLMEGYVLTQTQCDHCQMPMMELKGESECVVCPLVSKKAKKRAGLKRMGQAIMETFDSESPPKRLQEPLTFQTSPERSTQAAQDSLTRQEQPTISHGSRSKRTQDDLRNVGPPRHSLRRITQKEDEQNDLHICNNSKSRQDQHLEAREPSDSGGQEQGDIRGLLVNWTDEEQHLEEDFRKVKDDDRRGEIDYGEDGNRVVYEGDFEDNQGEDELEIDLANDSDVYDMEIGSQEVYHRLLNGWLLTNSNCPDCLAPMMQAASGEIECVLCNKDESENISPTKGNEGNSIFDASANRIDSNSGNEGSNEYQQHQCLVSFPPKRIIPSPILSPEKESKPLAASSYPDVGSHGAAHGLRYLAIPDELDLNNPVAVMTFLTKQKELTDLAQTQTDPAEDDPKTNRDAQSFRDQSPHRRVHNESQDTSFCTSPFGRGSQRKDAPNGSDDSKPDPAGAAIVDIPSSNSSSTMHTPIQLLSSGSDSSKSKPTNRPYDSVISSRCQDRDGPSMRSGGRAASVSKSVDRVTWQSRRVAEASSSKSLSHYAFDRPETSSSRSLSHHAFDHRSHTQEDFIPPVPLEIVPRNRSRRAETRALFDALEEDDSKLILKFESHPSDEFGNSGSRSQSPHKARLLTVRDDEPLKNPKSPPAFVLHHSISPLNSSYASCHMCKQALRKGHSSADTVCCNPRCTVYMIPRDNIDIFTSTMNEKMLDAKDFGSVGPGQTLATRDTTVGSQSREHSYDRWQMHSDPSMESTLASERFRPTEYTERRAPRSLPHFHENQRASFDGVGSADSVNSETINTLISRMSDTRSKLVSSNTSIVGDDRTDMAKLIDRLASAAVAIKDLEQSVYDVEDVGSPQRSLTGRPPTSPRDKAPYRGEDREIHWV